MTSMAILQTLAPEIGEKLQEMFRARRFRLSSLLWMNLVYNFLCRYDRAPNRAGKLKVIKALKPLYLARVVSFIRETLELDHAESEKKILRQAEIFRSHRRLPIQNLASPIEIVTTPSQSSSESLSIQ